MQRTLKRTHICTYCRPVSQFWRENSTQLYAACNSSYNCVGRLDRAACSLRTISEDATQQHHHGLPGASSQAPCSVILAESVLFYYHNVNPTEIYSRLHGRPASRQPAGRPDCSTDWTLRAVFVLTRWTLPASEPGFGFLSEFWV